MKWLNIVARIVDSDFGGAFSVAQIGIEHTEHTKEQDGRRAERCSPTEDFFVGREKNTITPRTGLCATALTDHAGRSISQGEGEKRYV